MKKLSIIIPVYNVAEFLPECLDSIIPQITEECELIIVNDGSTDASASVIEEYQGRYPWLTYISQPNAGLSAARNTGMANAKGQYFWFVDSDDYVEAHAVKTLLDALANNPGVDLLRFGYTLFNSDTGAAVEVHTYAEQAKIDSNLYFADHELMFQAWSGIYRAKFLEKLNLIFPPDKIYEDVPFNLEAYSSHANMAVISDALYRYRIREGSLLRSRGSLKKVESVQYILEVCDKIIARSAHNIADAALAVKKKLDYTYLYIDQLTALEELSDQEKWNRFKNVNHSIPLLKRDTPGLIYSKLLLKFFPSLFYHKRRKTLLG